ncbi:MAG: YeeE/YedE thiosulfate transporter family protein [Armatimonadota bacterium]|nr:YeeE/YedE thiosulfate transporter family protein [Armatimonadota bacterium]MDR5702292.1 YeeE/YedE thiosulfate transporter family protein [Armatimonadota bacterium]MDR7436034.1 YeeE/YedE thiosulfate transporter family protein [Armatimonadota bacterium]
MGVREKLREDYEALFRKQWPVWAGGLLIGIINVFLFLFSQPWTTLDGALNWGDWVLGRIGIVRTEALSPLLRSGSVINFGLLFGAMASALLAGEFGIRVGPRRELVKGLIGGLLLGTGAALARGCNIGGFFSATSALAASGLAMGVGLAAGAFLGTRYLLWEVEHLAPAMAPVAGSAGPLAPGRTLQPYLGAAVLFGIILWAFLYGHLGYADRALILFFGLLLGIVCQRSRVCFVQAFREPFLTGDSRHTRAMLLGLLVSLVGFALVKTAIFEKAEEFVRPTFWVGSLLGGLIFGVGMVLAGGCGGGTIWRAGEGHVKLWVALTGYIFSASLVRDWLLRSGFQERLGTAVFLPEVLGWRGSFALLLGVLLLWYLVTAWNEATRKLATL